MIVAIAETNGAGKGTVADYLVSLGFKHFSAREFFVEEINKRGLIVNRDSMRLVANELRQTYGPDYNIRTLYERALAYGNNAVIESLRCPAETSFIINKPDTHFIGIDADPHIRYKEQWIAKVQLIVLRSKDFSLTKNGNLSVLSFGI